nr:integrase, catalytic region, zinc finger, CCHC-type, peptidase aspartic, catalytic [Tanacetum cinerariifolium]
VIHKSNVSRPQFRSTQTKDKVVPNNSQVKDKKTEVEDHLRISSISNKTKSVTACNDSLKSRISNVNAVCATCGKCLVNSDHFACVTKLLNDVNARTKKPNALVEIIIFIVDSGWSKHMTGNLKLLINFVEKFLGTVKFGNDQIAPILGYGDLVQGAIMIKRVYYVEGLNHNLFFVGQFCDADLEVPFRKSTCYIHDLKGNDLLTGSRGTDLYSITLQDTNRPNLICLMAKATSSQAWVWHRHLSHLNFDTINLLSKNDIVTLHAYFAVEGILHQMSIARTPEQNGVVERQNRTLVEAARTMLSATKVPLFFWAEAIATACFTQNRSLTMALNHDSLSPAIQRQANVPQADRTVITSNELDLLFSPMFDELLNGSSKVVSKSSAVSATDAPYQCQHHTTPLNNHTTLAPTFLDDEFINIFSTSVQEQGETLSRHVDSSNMHTFYQRYPSEHRWTKDHPLEQVIGNPSQSVRTRSQLESDAEMCMFALIVSRTEPKNI